MKSWTLTVFVLSALFLVGGCGSDGNSDGDNNGTSSAALSCDPTCEHLLGLCPDLDQLGIDQTSCVSICDDQMDEEFRTCINDKSTCDQTSSCGQIDLTNSGDDAGTDAGNNDAGSQDTGSTDEDTGPSNDDNACGWSTACMKLPTSTASSLCDADGFPAYSCCISDATPPASAGCEEKSRSNQGDATTVDYCCTEDF